jgi:hypothetical protein
MIHSLVVFRFETVSCARGVDRQVDHYHRLTTRTLFAYIGKSFMEIHKAEKQGATRWTKTPTTDAQEDEDILAVVRSMGLRGGVG